MSKRRIDAQDTVDTVIHMLAQLQSEGWALSSLSTDVDYAQVGKKSAILPTETCIYICLRPVVA